MVHLLLSLLIKGGFQDLISFKVFYNKSLLHCFCVDILPCTPILLFYWVILFALTMKKQIMHMIKYKYVPFSFGKQRYDGKKANSNESSSLSSYRVKDFISFIPVLPPPHILALRVDK